ncbi:hypothetical protein B7H23_09420 [Notoacmeibacter marinus]|uniref:Uncharacterized protein n=1 Tax=Notoacmeibacter marinus TaxID=1876515 RepID=A0A231UWU5_9HYPH|nr:hypothetical protein B7H23_09420 [Notoacmeibacter marinus]
MERVAEERQLGRLRIASTGSGEAVSIFKARAWPVLYLVGAKAKRAPVPTTIRVFQHRRRRSPPRPEGDMAEIAHFLDQIVNDDTA